MTGTTDLTQQQAKAAVIEYVGFWSRVGAALIDSVIIGLVTAPLLYLAYGPAYFHQAQQGLAGGTDFLISYLLPAAGIILFWRYRSATPGKMLIHARIVDAKDFGPPSTGQLIGRYLAYFVSTLPLMLGLLWVAFDKRKQGWHDKLAGTVVIRDYD